MKRSFIVSMLMVVLSTPLVAQHSDWQVRLTDESIIEDASLLGLEGDSLIVFSQDFSGKLDVNSIERLSRGNSDAIEGAFGGLLIGGAVGYYIASNSDNSGTSYYSSSSSDESDRKLSATMIGGVIGGGLGVLTGSLSGRDVYHLEQKTPEEKLSLLQQILKHEGRTVALENSIQKDVVYLKNGSMIRGTVVEVIPDSMIRIVTADSSVFVFAMHEVARISKEVRSQEEPGTRSTPPVSQSSSVPLRHRRLSFAISAGVGLPVGDFREESGGAAKVGLAVGADIAYAISPGTDWFTSLYVAFHSIDELALGIPSGFDVGSWTLIWPMTGIRLDLSNDGPVHFFALGQIGMLAGTSPEILVSGSGGSVGMASSSASSVAFGLGIGLISHERFTITARYLYGNPEYEYTISNGSSSISGKGKQPTPLITVGLGVVF